MRPAINPDGTRWGDFAACTDLRPRDLEAFQWPETGDARRTHDQLTKRFMPALAVCAVCPVTRECWADRTRSHNGVIGGRVQFKGEHAANFPNVVRGEFNPKAAA